MGRAHPLIVGGTEANIGVVGDDVNLGRKDRPTTRPCHQSGIIYHPYFAARRRDARRSAATERRQSDGMLPDVQLTIMTATSIISVQFCP